MPQEAGYVDVLDRISDSEEENLGSSSNPLGLPLDDGSNRSNNNREQFSVHERTVPFHNSIVGSSLGNSVTMANNLQQSSGNRIRVGVASLSGSGLDWGVGYLFL